MYTILKNDPRMTMWDNQSAVLRHWDWRKIKMSVMYVPHLLRWDKPSRHCWQTDSANLDPRHGHRTSEKNTTRTLQVKIQRHRILTHHLPKPQNCSFQIKRDKLTQNRLLTLWRLKCFPMEKAHITYVSNENYNIKNRGLRLKVK